MKQLKSNLQGLATSGIFLNVSLLSLSQYPFNISKKKIK